MSDAYASAAIKLIGKNLVRLTKEPENREGRLNMANASTMAGIAFSNSMTGMVHMLGHSVGSLCHVPHGMAMSIILPHALEYNLEHSHQVRACLGELLLPLAGEEVYVRTPVDRRAWGFVECIRGLKRDLHASARLPRTLEETGKVPRNRLEEIARLSLGDASTTFNPVEVTYNDALDVLEKAYQSP